MRQKFWLSSLLLAIFATCALFADEYVKVIITGPALAGKTSVIKELERRGYYIVPEAATEVLVEEYKKLDEAYPESAPHRNPTQVENLQMKIFDAHKKASEKAERECREHPPKGNIILYDRAVFDTYVYTQVFYPEGTFSLQEQAYFNAVVTEGVGEYAKNVIFSEIVPEQYYDGPLSLPTRHENYEQSRYIGEHIRNAYQAFGFTLHPIGFKATIAEKADAVEALLKSWVESVYTPTVTIYADAEVLGNAAAERIAKVIIEKQNAGQERIVLGLATGNSPIPTYRAFKRIVREYDLDLSNVVTVNLDEYIGLPTTHPQSYHSFMFSHLFDDLVATVDNPRGISLENIHIPKGAVQTEDDLSYEERALILKNFPAHASHEALTQEEQFLVAAKRADDYEALIKSVGPVDLQILGIGRNGHIGFAEPGTSFDSTTMVATLTENTRSVNSAFFDGDLTQVPHFAITMGISTILQAKEILLIATGSSKAAIIDEALSGIISPQIPCTSLWLHPNASFYLDKEAAELLAARCLSR